MCVLLLFVVFCYLIVVLLCVGRCSVLVCCSLLGFVYGWLLVVVCCCYLLFVVGRVLCMLLVFCCFLFVVSCLLFRVCRCSLFAARRSFCGVFVAC